MGTKRKRLALSCVDCRRRKVKCDRTLPVCVRCQKGGNADNCTYVSHTGEEVELPTPSEDSPEDHHVPPPQVAASGEPFVIAALREMSPHLEVQSRQPPEALKFQTRGSTRQSSHLERAVQMEVYPRSTGFRPSANAVNTVGIDDMMGTGYHGKRDFTSDFGKVMVRGQGLSTHYYGPSFAISMLLQFEELSKFVKGMLTNVSSLKSVKERMTSARIASKTMVKPTSSSLHSDLIRMVPERSLADALTNKYIDTFETTYRILHVPTFRHQYEEYWHNPEASKPEFVVQLLLVAASMHCVVPGGPPGFVGRSSACREIAHHWITACELWINEQSQKHITLAHFQIHVLIFVAKGMNCMKTKREWMYTGQLLRMAMSVGMHREPRLLSRKISVFEQEMRRRLWFTILELDLITTTDRGMPPTIDSFSWDVVPPHNLDDEDFDETTETMPASKPRSTFTRSSYLHITADTLGLRVEIIGRINSVRLGLDIDAVMQYDNKLRAIIDEVPHFASNGPASFAQNLLTLTYYELILILHIPFASQSPNKARFFYSVASKRDISFKTLQVYSRMSDDEALMSSYIRGDACRACLALAHDICMSSDRDIITNHDLVLSLLQNIVDLLATRFGKLGQGFHGFWITLSAWSLLRWKLSGSESSQPFARDAADRVEHLYQQVLTTQVSIPLADGTVQSGQDPEVAPVDFNQNLSQTFETAFPELDQMNFFDDPFSDMNFDLSTVWSLNGYNPSFA